jgi:hypothetical protein
MSRRNFILLIIVLILLGAFFFYLFYLRPTPNPTNGEDGGGFFSNLNPFGKTTVIPPKTTTPNENDSTEFPPNTQEEIKKLVKVSTMPVAGYTPFQKEKELGEYSSALRYVARENGNIYQTFTDIIKERKFSNTIIPRVYEALFGNDGNTVLMRYLKNDGKTIQTFIGNLPIEKIGDDSIITNDVQGTFLPDNIIDVSVSPDTNKIFYLINTNDTVAGIMMNLKDSKKTQIFDSPFTEWLSGWAGNSKMILTTKASGVAPGYIYELDVAKRTPSKVIGDINGITALPSPSGKKLIYSDNNLTLKVYNIETRESITLGLRTQAEKCVWDSGSIVIYCAIPKNISSGIYPDTWYQGEVSFNDQIWSIDTTTNSATILVDPLVSGGEEIDAIKIMLDTEENFLFFVNKKDSFLWSFDLRQTI